MPISMLFRRALAVYIAVIAAAQGATTLSYRPQLDGRPTPTLSVSLQSIVLATGIAVVNGVDTQPLATPFRFDWGDGQTSQSAFPASHTYSDRTRAYIVTVTSTYRDGSTDSAQTTARFVAPAYGRFVVPDELAVRLPATMPNLVSSLGGSLPAVQPLVDRDLGLTSRAGFEHVLGAFAVIQRDLVNDDIQRANGAFRQIVMATPDNTGPLAFSVWYAEPAMLAGRTTAFGTMPDWSSLAHEMGHNMTLNSPAAFRLGGKIDGNANAIVSETLAQIFQHVTCHLLVNEAAFYGVPDDLAVDIARRALASFAEMKRRSGTGGFTSWNDPATAEDEALPTFMTLAYQFFAAGDLDGVRYRTAVKRLMHFLQHWNASWQTRFSPREKSATAEAFRATMMVAAISYGVEQDLRVRFRGRGFPIDDTIYASLTSEVGPYPADATRLVNLSVRSRASTGDNTLAVGFAVGGRDTKQVLVRGVGPTLTTFGLEGTLAEPQLRLFGGNGARLQENTGWGGSPFLSGAFQRVGAFPLGSASRDTAFLPTLPVGPYTVHVTSNGPEGVALVEAYDLDDLGGTARLTNLSARTRVGSGDALLIAGFAIKGAGAQRVLVRAVGPGLVQFGVGGVLADPRLQLFSGTQLLQTNDDWGGGAALAATFAQVGAFTLPAGSKDAAFIATLPAGTYTAHVSSADGTPGIALVEVYEVAP